MKECHRCFRCWNDALEVCPYDRSRLLTAFEGPPVLDDKYRLDQRLGHGGMGVVYLAHHLALHKTFALKLIARTGDPAFLARFRVEAEALGTLKHPNIVDVTDFGVDGRAGGLPYLVMEHLEGTSLADRLQQIGKLPLERTLPILQSIADAVDYAHERGILHLDLKPGNVFVCRNGAGGESIKIVDFGLARFVAGRLAIEPPVLDDLSVAELPADGWRDGSTHSPHVAIAARDEPSTSVGLTGEQHFFGTLAYMSPELLRGQPPTTASDIYSFGVLTYEILCGRRPFQGAPAEIIAGHCSQAPPSLTAINPALPEEIDGALLPAMEKVAAARPRGAAEVVQRIESAAIRAHVRTWRRKEIPRRIGVAAAAALLLPFAVAPLSRLGVVEQLENRSVDARFLGMPTRAPDSRLVLVSLDEASLVADPTPLSEKADDFGRQLSRVFISGARRVAIDFLLPEAWSRSRSFSELILKYRDSLTLAMFSTPNGVVIGPEALNPLTAAALGAEKASDLFAFVNLDEDADGVIRHARLRYVDTGGMERETWARHAVRGVETGTQAGERRDAARFWIDHSVDWRAFTRVAWRELTDTLDRQPGFFRDRVVLVGGDFAGFGGDYHRVPSARDRPEGVSGLVLQALIADTILSRFPVREAQPFTYLLGIGLAAGALMLAILLSTRWPAIVLLVATLLGLHVASAFALARLQVLLPVVAPILILAAAGLVGAVLRLALPAFPKAAREAA